MFAKQMSPPGRPERRIQRRRLLTWPDSVTRWVREWGIRIPTPPFPAPLARLAVAYPGVASEAQHWNCLARAVLMATSLLPLVLCS